jgi:transcriptional antiterminator NusG
MNAYCVFCKTAYEEKAAININRLYQEAGVRAIAPVRILKERCRGVVKKVSKPLMQGYIFIFSELKIDPGMLSPVQDVIKLLRYQNGEYELLGPDLEYAEFISANNGIIGISDVICEGREVKVLSGPLEDYKGTIIKLDRRKQRVLLRVSLGGIERDISLSVNILSAV